MEINSLLEKVLVVCNRKAEVLRLVGASFDSKITSLKRIRKKKFFKSESFAEKKVAIFSFICLSLLTFDWSNINWKCSKICIKLTERAYGSAVFKIFLNIMTICVIIEQ